MKYYLLILALLTSTTLAETWTVDDDGKADFDNIQAAVNAASDGDEIVVMPGTYTSTADDVVDMFGKAVWLHSSTGAGVTIIDGEGMRRGIYCHSGETNKTIIEGFTITNGYSAHIGGGMGNFNNSSPTLTDCIFENNSAIGEGGGMRNVLSSPTLTNCTFTNNTASYGGGMGNYNNSSPTLTGCTFTGNIGSGGGMWNYTNSNPTLTDCIFENNGLHSGGGGMFNGGNSSPTLTNCTFENNNAGSSGGAGMRNYGGIITLTNCIIKDNLASSNDGGAGIYNYGGSSPTLIDTVVCGNKMGQIYGNWTDGGGNTVDNNCPPPDDADSDGTPDKYDNCYLYNPDQADCNGNEIGDICDIADGTSYDINGNTIPDECEDSDGDGVPDNIDVFPNDPNEWADSDGDGVGDNEDTAPQGGCCVSTGCYQTTAVACDGLGGTWLDASASCDNCPAICNEDINGDGVIDVSDLLAIIAAWGACP